MIGNYHTEVVWLSVHPLWQYNRKRLLFVMWQWGTCHTFQLSARNVIVCATAHALYAYGPIYAYGAEQFYSLIGLCGNSYLHGIGVFAFQT